MYPDEAVLARCEDDAPTITSRVAEAGKDRAGMSFDEIFQRYHAMVYQLVCHVLGDREEALDVAQEVFLAVHSKLQHFRGESSLKTWIYRIALNRAANRCRWWKRLRRRGTVSLDEHLSRDPQGRSHSEILEAEGKSPEEVLLATERRTEIGRCLRRLPVEQRLAVILRDIEGFSYEEIAEATHASLGTVKSRIARGRDELKRRLDGMLN